jgi:drug/metabolite transporter (DMT)-like permease
MRPRFFLLAAVIIWGWTFVATKIVLPYVTAVELLGLRLLIGIPILGAIILTKRVRLGFTAGDVPVLAAATTVFTAHFLIQITGLRFTSATNTGWIIAVTPLVLAVLSVVFLKERLGARELAGVLAATVGILLLVSRGQVTSFAWLKSVGDWLILASAHTWAIYTILTRDISRSRDPMAVTFVMLLAPGVVLLSYMLFASNWTAFTHMPAQALAALLFLGVFGTALGHWFWQEGVAGIGAARAGMFLFLEPLATTALAVPYLHEPFGWATAVGGLLVMAGVYTAQRKQ